MLNPSSKCAVLGLGQVGLPLARALAERYPTVGVDVDEQRLNQVRASAGPLLLLELSDDMRSLTQCDVIFVTLPSGARGPVDFTGSALAAGCRAIGDCLQPGTTIVFESTVHPGATEELCIPLIEETSGLTWKQEFFVAYSPERINPGDREHTLQSIPKLLAADSEATLERVAAVYESIIPAGVHRMSSMRAAELTKVLENVQRDVNIALMNELSMVSHGLGIDTVEVLQAAATKWNFLPFRPGLVGGSCLSLASSLWQHTHGELGLGRSLVASGREINEGMVEVVTRAVARWLAQQHIALESTRVVQLGAAFKADVSQVVDSKSVELALGLHEQGMLVWVHDPVADFSRCRLPLEVCPADAQLPTQCDVLILAVAHSTFQMQPLQVWCESLRGGGLVVDLTQTWDASQVRRLGYEFWRL